MFKRLWLAQTLAWIIRPEQILKRFAQGFVQFFVSGTHGLIRLPSVAFKYERSHPFALASVGNLVAWCGWPGKRLFAAGVRHSAKHKA